MFIRTQDAPTDTLLCDASEALRPTRTKRSYLPVESVQRALLVLRRLNELGVAQVYQLSRETGVHKATMVRMLETLMAEGYVTRDECQGGYCVTSKVKELSAGFSGKPRLIEAAREPLLGLTRMIKWPASLATIESGEVVLNFSTSAMSNLSYPFCALGRPMDITSSSLGRVSLAFCDPAERERLIDHKASEMGMDTSTFTRVYVDPVLEPIRRAGYALSIPIRGEHRFQFVAVPIIEDGRLLAALGIGFYMTAVSGKDVQKNFVLPLKEVATTIGNAWKAV